MIIETNHEVIYISGTLRANQWAAIKTTAYLVYESYPLGVTLDFAGIQCVSSTGEGTFVDAIQDIERHRLPFDLAHVPSDVAARLRQRMGESLSCRYSRAAEERRIYQAIFSETWWQKLWGVT